MVYFVKLENILNNILRQETTLINQYKKDTINNKNNLKNIQSLSMFAETLQKMLIICEQKGL